MGIKEIIKKSFIDGYATSDITISTILLCIVCTVAIALYIYMVYKYINKKSFYNKNFNMSLVVIAVITSMIILTIQSNIVVSLGMVGALSIVRFRTAIKDPMDLVFLFWSISAGIICGAGFALIGVLGSIVITILILWFSVPVKSENLLVLVVNATSYKKEKEIIKKVKEQCNYFKVRARNVSKNSLNMAIEVKVKDTGALIEKIIEMDDITNVSLVESDGNITA